MASEKMQPQRLLALPLSQTFVLRLLSVVTQSVMPVYLVSYLGYTPSTVGLPITLIWVGNAAGALLSFYVLRRQTLSNLVGFSLISASFLGYSLGPAVAPYVPILVFVGGAGSGSVQPLLAPSVHMNSTQGSKYRGIGLYSVALSLGLVVGPLVSSFARSLPGFLTLFFLLGLLSVTLVPFSFALSIRSAGAQLTVPRESISFYRQALGRREFLREFVLNFLYSLTLPVVLSYSAVVAKVQYGVQPSTVLLLMTGMFVLSTVIRAAASFSHRDRFDRQMAIPAFLLPVSLAALAIHSSMFVFSAGLLLFAVPHALVYPWTLFNSLQSADSRGSPAVSYLFTLSSGVAETVSPPAVSTAVAVAGTGAAFVASLPFALAAAAWASYWYFREVKRQPA